MTRENIMELHRKVFLSLVRYKPLGCMAAAESARPLVVKRACGIDFGYAAKPEGGAGVMMTDRLLEASGMSLDELDRAAMENTRKTGFIVMPVADVLEAELGTRPPELPGMTPLFVITSTDRHWGAAALLFPEVLEEAYDLIRDNFYIIPSSIHELIAAPLDAGDPDELAELIGHVNDTSVDPEDRLSYSLYRYDGGTGLVTPAA